MDTAYNRLSLLLLSGLDMTSADLRVLLVTSSYTFDADDDYIADLSNELSGGGYARVAMTSKAVAIDDVNDRATFDAADTVFSSLGAAAGTPAAAIIYKQVTNDSDSPVLAYHPLSTPDTPTGVDYTIEWDADGIIAVQRGDDMAGAKYLSGVVVTISGTSARTTVLSAGRYLVTTDTNCFWKQGGSTVVAADATAGNGFLAAGAGVIVNVDGSANGYIAAIQDTAGGTLFVQEMT